MRKICLFLALGSLIGVACWQLFNPRPAKAADAKRTPQATSVWAPLGFGLDNFVTAIAADGNNNVYAAGTFIKNICGNATCDSGNVPANRVAKWDGTQWSPLGFGLLGVPTSIVINQGKVDVVGAQGICGDAACSTSTTVPAGVAVWDGGSWSAPFPPLAQFASCCRSIEFFGSDIYGGGNFIAGQTPAGQPFANWFGLTKLSGGAWVAPPHQGLILGQAPNGFDFRSAAVASFFTMGNDLYVGGIFDQSSGTLDQNNNDSGDHVMDLRLVARLSGGTTWQPLPGQGLQAKGSCLGPATATCGDVSAFAAIGTDLYVGGSFNQTFDGSLTLNGIAKFDTTTHTWSALPNNGLNGGVGAGIADPGGLATRGNDLFAIGGFTATADNEVTNLNGIAWLHNGAWSTLGNGFVGGGPEAIAVTADNIYVGGKFTQNGDNTAPGMNNIARLVTVVTAQLEMTKTVDVNQVTVGQNLTYTITVKNKGPQTAQAVTLTDPLASNVTFSSATGTQGSCSESKGVVTCNMGDLANAGVATVTIVVTANAPGDIVNNATVSGANSDSVQASSPKSTALPGPTIQYSAATYTASEGDGRATITVTRSGDSSSSATVRYATSDGTAKEGKDYTAAFGVLNFAAGETTKSFTVLVIDNALVDGNRTVNLGLSNPSGAGLTTQSTATLTINDNDSAGGANPLDQTRFFVQLHYFDFLSRYPDQSGWDFWTNNINNCSPQSSCTDVQRINTSAAFFLSIEFQQTGYLVERMYKAAYGDIVGTSTFNGAHQLSVPVVRFAELISDTQQIGSGLVVLQLGWEQLLENNKQAFAMDFVQRPRFMTAFPASTTPAEFVNQLNQNAGGVLSSGERTTAINLFNGAANSANTTARAQALRQVAEDQDLYNNEFNRAFVLMEYFGYLRRNPNDPPDADYTGYDFWLTKLNQFNGNYINAEMVKGFISASEYRQRFGP